MSSSDNNWQDAGRNGRSYLLRCWQEGELVAGGEPGESLVWRFALVQLDDDAHTKGFICLEDLFVYLRQELAGKSKKKSPISVQGT